jgi:hypothetical protein
MEWTIWLEAKTGWGARWRRLNSPLTKSMDAPFERQKTVLLAALKQRPMAGCQPFKAVRERFGTPGDSLHGLDCGGVTHASSFRPHHGTPRGGSSWTATAARRLLARLEQAGAD